MSKTINIGGDPNDIHYRYKRHVIETTYLNKKGGETVIINLEQISKDLNTPYEDFRNKFVSKKNQEKIWIK